MTTVVLTRPTTGAAPVPDPVPLCIVGGRAHPATNGLLCWTHFDELSTWLYDIEREAAYLDPVPAMSSRYGGGGGGALASERSPAALDAIAYTDPRSTAHGYRHIGPVCRRCPTLMSRQCVCPPLPYRREIHWSLCPRAGAHPSCLAVLGDRDEHDAHAEHLVAVLNVLHGLAQRVRDEREFGLEVIEVVDRMPGVQWPGPVCARPCTHDTCQSMAWWRLIPVQPTIGSERRLLTRQLDWLAAQDWVDDFRRELADLRSKLIRANRNEEDQPLSGHCYRLVDGVECGGKLWPTEPKHSTGYDVDDDTPNRQRVVVCDQRPAEHRWERHELAMLSLILERQRRDELPPAAPGPPPPPAYPGPAAGNGDRLTAVIDQQRREEAASVPTPAQERVP